MRWGRTQSTSYVVAVERARRLEVQAVDSPDVSVVIAVDLLAVTAFNPHRPQFQHLLTARKIQSEKRQVVSELIG